MPELNDLQKLNDQRKIQLALIDDLLKQVDKEDRANVRKLDIYKEHVSLLKEINMEIGEIGKQNKTTIDALIQQEGKLKGLTGLQSSLVELDRKRLKAQQSLGPEAQESLNNLADKNKEILALTGEETISLGKLKAERQTLLDIVEADSSISEELTQNAKDQGEIAEKTAKMSEKQQKFLNKQLEVYEGIKDTIGGVLETASLLTSTLGGVMGIATIGAGKFLGKLGETRSQLGGISEVGTTALSFIDDNAVANATELGNQFGGIKNVSAELQASTSVISTNMGISGTEAASLLGDFSRLNDGSSETALNLVKSSQEFAKQNGIIPAVLMADLAGSAEAFAEYGDEGGKNLIKAGVAARKMGVSLKTMTGISDNLLDFETSITAELELGAMLGKNINLDRARALAYAGKTTEATQETLKALGGVDAFNKMDIFSKRKTAQLLGISVSELSKMVSGQEDAAKLAGTMEEKFGLAGEAVSAGMNKYLGTTVEGIGGVLIATGQMGGGLKTIGDTAKGAFKMVAKLFAKKKLVDSAGPLTKAGLPDMRFKANKGGGIADKLKGAATSNPAGKGGIMQSMGKINMSAVLKGAAAMVLVAASVFVLGKALQEYSKVGLSEIGAAAGGMLLLGGAMVALGYLLGNPASMMGIALGAAAMLVIASAVLVLGIALQQIGTGFEMLSSGIGTLMPQLLSISTVISGLVLLIPAIGLLSLSLMGLSASLVALGVAGILASPGLLALSVVGTVTSGLNSLMGGGDSGGSSNENPAWVKELKAAFKENKDVYIDGHKITAAIRGIANNDSSGTYQIV